jgi:hypothetical protein
MLMLDTDQVTGDAGRLRCLTYGAGYNVQIAVDAEHPLIVAHEVTNQGYDRDQLAPMAFKAQQAMGCQQLTAVADRGYFNGDQVLSCEGTGIAPIVPKTLTSSGAKRGFFTQQDFIYDAQHDHYTCPAGTKLTKSQVPGGSHRRLRFLPPPEAPASPVRSNPGGTPTKLITPSWGQRYGLASSMCSWSGDEMPNAATTVGNPERHSLGDSRMRPSSRAPHLTAWC